MDALLALVTDAFGGHGGIAQYNRDFLNAIRDDRATITVLPRHVADAPAPPRGIDQQRPPRGRLAYLLRALFLAVRRPSGSIFCGHLHLAPFAAVIARLTNARLIIQLHGIEIWPRPTWLQRAALEAADLVLCVSRDTRKRVLVWAAIAPERVQVIPDTVEDRFTAGDAARLRTELGLLGKQVLLTVGRMDSHEKYKGQDRVIAALPELLARGHNVMYVIAGAGDDRSRLERLARERRLADHVLFLGPVSAERLVDCYRMADLYVMPSTGEGFGIAFLEAMASGTRALGLAVAGATDALAEGALGAAVSEAELPDAIARLLATPKPDPDALSKAVRARFGRDAFRAQIQGAIDRLLAVA